jgi:hypothetical protein
MALTLENGVWVLAPASTAVTVETALEGASEGTADVVSVPELNSAATTAESPTETPF